MKTLFSKKFNIFILIIISCLFLVPYFIMLISCFSTNSAIKGNDILNNISLNNFIFNFNLLIKEKYLINSLLNSFIVSIFASLLSVFMSSMAGYGYMICEKNKKIKKLYLFSFFPMLIPSFILIIPIFLIFNSLNLIDTYIALIIGSISVSFNIYLFKQNSKLLPIELLKIARIDGLSEFSIYKKIYIPCMKPVFVTALLLSFLESWNALLIPSVIARSKEMFTNTLFLNSLGTIWSSDYGLLMISLIFSTIPIIVLFIIFQKNFKSGINISN
ncbi:MAG: carbohydrate ABC transporter permease [Bacilli bacterium]|nr:carbohydrate ABC transporter permease [Bacilli bacterium]